MLAASFRDAATESREEVAGSLADLESPFAERVVVHTCHRAELVGVLRDGEPVPALPGVRVHRGAAAVERLLLVAGGLESAVVAEEQVLGQVRAAYETAMARRWTGPILNELFRRAIRFGKQVRSEARPGTDRSLADRAVRWIEERLGPEARPAAALVIGSGEMGRQLAGQLAARGMTLTVASRSAERAERLVSKLANASRHRPSLLEAALAGAAKHDVVAVAVRSASTPIEWRHLAPAAVSPLVVDLSAPPAVSAEAAERLGDRLLDLDRLDLASSSPPLTPSAERRLRAAAVDERDRFLAWLEARAAGDGVTLLRAHAAEIRGRHLERLRRSNRLDDEQMAAVEAASAAMLGELLHGPTVQLRRDPGAAAAVRRVFGLDA